MNGVFLFPRQSQRYACTVRETGISLLQIEQSNGGNMREVLQEFVKACAEAPRIFFAPLFGAVRAVKQELNRPDTGG
jgi:hypothetical protein